LISEGLRTDEINERAAKGERGRPAYQVSRQQVDFYRRKLGVKVEEMQEAGELGALRSGLALKENRVESLKTLAEKLEEELLGENLLWVDRVRFTGGRKPVRIDYEEFNEASVRQYRGLLDDIAKELGDRRQKVDLRVDAREALAKLLGVPADELPAGEPADAQP
jgi:hypothetical protein